MKYGIVIFPGKELQDLANSFRKRHDPKYALIPPHVTLIQPFESDEHNIKAVSDKLTQVASHFQQLQLTIKKISTFQPVNNVIYFKLEPTKDLEDLHVELQSTIVESKEEYSFVPHITLGQELTSDEHLDMFSTLRMRQFDHTETVDRFHLLYELENGSWTVYETFRLGKE